MSIVYVSKIFSARCWASGQKISSPETPPFFAREPLRFCVAPAARRYTISRIFDKVGSSEVVNILHNLTFGNFSDFFVGGAERRPFILWLAAQSAARQTEVRYPLRFFVFALLVKRIFGIIRLHPQI